MIKVKITMSNGREYKVSNFVCNSVQEWISRNLMPHGVLLKFYKVFYEEFINIDQIVNIQKYEEEDIEEISDLDDEPLELNEEVDEVKE